jgi:hypothetical protein
MYVLDTGAFMGFSGPTLHSNNVKQLLLSSPSSGAWMKKKAERRRRSDIGLYQAVRDVLIAAINKGQLPVVFGGIIIVSMLWRMPEKDVGVLVFRLLDSAERERLIGYAFGILSLTGLFFHARYQRKLMTAEMQRVSSERNDLQQRELGKRIRSSEGSRT